MATHTLDTDYLVVGCGAGGMAFTDALVSASDARVVMVDRRHAPGGHWLDAYPFVRLHMPSAVYGVNSLPLGNDAIDRDGGNAGLYERAGGPEICAYYDRVMRERLLPTGQVRYFPMCEHLGGTTFASRLSGDRYEVTVRTRVVDATYLEPSVPASSPPPFTVDEGARCAPVGELPRLSGEAERFTIVGAGKTAMDACLWLLDGGVAPDRVRWVKPREPWLINRRFFQCGELVGTSFVGVSLVTEAAATAATTEAFLGLLADAGWLLRADPAVTPTMFKGALATEAELERLREVEDVTRLGHVRRVGTRTLELEHGSVPTTPGTLHVHCAAKGLARPPAVPVFTEDRVTVQAIRLSGFPFSAAFEGFVEASREGTEEKNRLCPVNPYPHVALDVLRTVLGETSAARIWQDEPDVQAWLGGARLHWLRGLEDYVDDPAVQQALGRYLDHVDAGMANLGRMLAEAAL
ncbi:MAG: hypothetical protein ACRDZR_00790 [Acidimicrobiales bacterium]